jgi:putative DNA primase/helicase
MKNLFRSLKNLIRTIGVVINTPPVTLPPHCSNINVLLLHLCDFDHDLHKWVLRWLAYPLHHPGVKMSTCLVFNGGQGSGQIAFFNLVMARVYGSSSRRIKGHHLRNTFNGWAVGARMVIIDGEYSRAMARTLKSLLASSHLWVNEPAKQERMEQNQMNFVFLSNGLDFLPVQANDRRFVVVEVPPPQPPAIYRAFNAEIQNGGVEAFRHYLLHELDMANFNEHTPPPQAHIAPGRIAVRHPQAA